MIDLGSLVAKVVVDSSDGTKKLQDFSTQADTTDGKLKTFAGNIAGTVKTAVLGLSTAAAGGAVALYGMANKAAETTDRIDKLSQKTGISKEAFQEWDYAMGQSGVDVGVLQNGVKTLVSQMDAAKNGSETAKDAFKSLGLEWEDGTGKLKSQEEMLNEAMTALANMEDGSERAKLSVELFGKAGTELAPLLNSGAAGIDDLKSRAHELGLVMSDEAITAGVVFGDTLADVKSSVGAVGTKIGVEVMPIILDLCNVILENMPTIQKVISTAFAIIQEVVKVAGGLIGGFIDVIKALVENAQTEGTLFNAVWENIKIVIDTTLSAVRALFDTFSALFRGDWEGFWNGVKKFLGTILEGLITLIQNQVRKFRDAGKAIFTGVWDGIKSVWNDIKNWVDEKVGWLADKLMFWKDSQSEMSDDADGSHRTGLYSVPFDDYKAILHRGEMVLTQPEADRYRKGSTTGSRGDTSITQNFYGVKEEKTAFVLHRQMKKTARELGLT